ncbi:hypothetical protein [Burkholderia guangdongensis]|uniref:hypothetical protein n=1 Tax=Burkholderia guangdongensis TaxID=1792500 RepID=UPI0015C702A9|nr:hypothetical protein [Burkholderia guangdongensis]
MGRKVKNFHVFCDYATTDKYSAVELHMELPIPHADLKKVQGWLDSGEWDSAEAYLVGKYPQYFNLLKEWLAASKARSEGSATRADLVAA